MLGLLAFRWKLVVGVLAFVLIAGGLYLWARHTGALERAVEAARIQMQAQDLAAQVTELQRERMEWERKANEAARELADREFNAARDERDSTINDVRLKADEYEKDPAGYAGHANLVFERLWDDFDCAIADSCDNRLDGVGGESAVPGEAGADGRQDAAGQVGGDHGSGGQEVDGARPQAVREPRGESGEHPPVDQAKE